MKMTKKDYIKKVNELKDQIEFDGKYLDTDMGKDWLKFLKKELWWLENYEIYFVKEEEEND